MGRAKVFVVNRLRQRMIDAREAGKMGERWFTAQMGASAFDHGKSPCECPFELDAPGWHYWMAGWRGRYDKRFL